MGGNPQDVEKSTNIIIVISCAVLAVTYFLPVEALWAPVDAWRGYYVGNEFAQTFNMGLAEVFPFAVGAIVLLAFMLFKWPKLSCSLIMVFGILWAISLLIELSSTVFDMSPRFSALWFLFGVLPISILLVLTIITIRRFQKQTATLTLLTILAAASILQQAYSVAWYLLEDRLPLNIGAVTGTAAAAVLFVALLIQSLKLYSK